MHLPPPGWAGTTPIFPMQPLTPEAKGTSPSRALGPNKCCEGNAYPSTQMLTVGWQAKSPSLLSREGLSTADPRMCGGQGQRGDSSLQTPLWLQPTS